MSTQLVQPNTNTKDTAGFCLRFVQSVYGAPAKYRSAWESWNATSIKHPNTEPIPDVSVPVWFSHFGTYGNPPSYENWGHVVAWIPGRGYLSSPGTGYGQEWFDNIAAIEARFNAKYVGWSEDINGLRVAEVNKQGASSMSTIYYTEENGTTKYAFAGDGVGQAAWMEFTDYNLAAALVQAHHGNQIAVYLTPGSFRDWAGKYQSKMPVSGSSGSTTVTVPDFNITMTGQAVKK